MRLQLALLSVVMLLASRAHAQEEEAKPADPPAPPPETKSVDGRVIVEIAGYQDSNAVSVLTPSIGARLSNPTAGWGANGRYLVDVVTAASPDIVSTASPRWTEVRHAGNIGASYKPGNTGVAVGGSTSYTPDYLALGGNAQLTHDLFQKNTTLVAGYGFGHDVIGRVGTPFSAFSRTLDFHAINGGLSQVVNESIVVGVFGDFIVERGDQSKPYRYIPMFSPADSLRLGPGAEPGDVAAARINARPLEQLPLERERAALTGRLAWRFTSSTLRLEERLYGDTWGLMASTTDARYFVDLSERVMIWPHLRGHVQNGVSFYERTYIASGTGDLPLLRTGDRELSPLTSGTFGGGIRIGLGKSGHADDFVLQGTIDGTYTEFHDALYVKNRFAGLFATTVEVAF